MEQGNLCSAAFLNINKYKYIATNPRVIKAWKNWKEVPRWGVAETQKMSPSTAAAMFSN